MSRCIATAPPIFALQALLVHWFREMDVDGSGTLDTAEMSELLRAAGLFVSQEDVHARFARAAGRRSNGHSHADEKSVCDLHLGRAGGRGAPKPYCFRADHAAHRCECVLIVPPPPRATTPRLLVGRTMLRADPEGQLRRSNTELHIMTARRQRMIDDVMTPSKRPAFASPDVFERKYGIKASEQPPMPKGRGRSVKAGSLPCDRRIVGTEHRKTNDLAFRWMRQPTCRAGTAQLWLKSCLGTTRSTRGPAPSGLRRGSLPSTLLLRGKLFTVLVVSRSERPS